MKAPNPRPALAQKRPRSSKTGGNPPSVTSPVLTVREAAKRMSTSHHTVYRLIKTGRLDYTRVGTVIRVPIDAIDRYLSAGLVSA
jgi:excisionase family DNA binding protein